MTPIQLNQIIESLAKSPFVQSEMEAVKVAIFSYAKAEAEAAIPYGLKTACHLLQWLYKKIKGECSHMAGIATITVNDGTNALEGVSIAYTVSSVSCTATTDSTGIATIEGLEAGSYEFTATLSGYTSASVTLTVTDDTTITGTISLTKESETTVSNEITTAVTTAAIAAAETSLASTATTTTTGIADTINAKITELTNEIKNTDSAWVKARDSIEIAALAGALAGIVAGLKQGIEELKDKIS